MSFQVTMEWCFMEADAQESDEMRLSAEREFLAWAHTL
jgi:uncharacterized membrane protein YidH (DUF202 family)